LRPRAVLDRLLVGRARTMARLQREIELAPCRAQLGDGALDLPLRLGQRARDGRRVRPAGGMFVGRRGSSLAGEDGLGGEGELQLAGLGFGPAQAEALHLARDRALRLLEAALQTPALGDPRTDHDAAHPRDLDGERIDDAQRADRRAERLAIDAHALEPRRLELEADLARRGTERRARMVALAERLQEPLQAPLPVLGRIRAGLQPGGL